jgi:hypothetical protein
MTVASGSRYQGQTPVVIPSSGTAPSSTAVFRLNSGLPTSFQYYQVQMWERFDTIAFRVLGRSELWWMIADANPEVIYPDQLAAGMIIRIPTPS